MAFGPVSAVPSPSCAAEALAMAEAAFDFFNKEDLLDLPVVVQAESLRAWARLDAKQTVAHARLLSAFDAGEGPKADGQSSLGAWLRLFTRVTDTAAKGQAAAARRMRRNSHVAVALSSGTATASYGRWICEVVGRFPAEHRDAIEEILVDAAAAGALIDDLTSLATAAFRKVCPNGLETDEERENAERGLTLSKTFGGAGRMNADLNRHATALAEQVIEALAVKRGPEDTRTKRQRRHDALVDAFERLVASDLLPERGGSKPQVKVDMGLATLRRLPGAKQAEQEWIRAKELQLARREVAGTGSIRELLKDLPDQQLPPGLTPSATSGIDGGFDQPPLPGLSDSATLAGVGPISDGLAAALACDSLMTPTVAGAVNHDALEAMTDEWLHAHGLSCRGAWPGACCGACTDPGRSTETDCTGTARPPSEDEADAGSPEAGDTGGGSAGTGRTDCAGCPHCTCDHGHAVTPEARARLRNILLRWAIDVLSGPGGLASYLRTGLLNGPMSTPSIVLDAGTDDRTVPTRLERLVRRRDTRCRFPGCAHPAELSQIHHLIPRSRGGPTVLRNLLTLCPFHHLIAVHAWGWDVRLNPDGTVTATGPDGRVLREREPPGDPPLQAA